ncbi:MAG: hypothetical protein IT463_12755 [Planctomycetes bacterium]|nr:hypothetical protein [Planctomycetota bacterium]
MRPVFKAGGAAAAVAFVVALGALALAQDPKPASALAGADAAYSKKEWTQAAGLYAAALKRDLPAAEKDRALARHPLCLALAGDHEALDKVGSDEARAWVAQLGGIRDLALRADSARTLGAYFASRDHDYHYNRELRDYAMNWEKLPDLQRRAWSYRNTTRDDVTAARGLMQLAHEASRAAFDLAVSPRPREVTQRHLAITLDYCDLMELDDRVNGPNDINEMALFAPGSEAIERPEEVLEEEPVEDEPVAEQAEPLRNVTGPEQEPFTRRGYFNQPRYPNLPLVTTQLELAQRLAQDLGDKPAEAMVLYRRAMLQFNVGLYANATLNARLTDWRNPGVHEPDAVKDPRPLLRRLLKEHPGSVWSDEAQFLLGYVGYYLNDFTAARSEFAVLEQKHPKSRYVGEARRLVQVVDFPQLFTSFSGAAVQGSAAFVGVGEPLAVSVYARNLDRVQVSLRPLNLGTLLAGAKGAEHVFSRLEELEKLPGFEAALGGSVMDQAFSVNASNYYVGRENLPLYTGQEGVFLLEVKGGPVLERKLVQVGDLVVTRRRGTAAEEFWVTTRSGQPVPRASLRGGYHENLHVTVHYEEMQPDPDNPGRRHNVRLERGERRLAEHAFSGETDDSGLCTVVVPPHGMENLWALVSANGRTWLVNQPREPQYIEDPAPWAPAPKVEAPRDLRVFVYTDRPVYRPGDLAHLRVVVRSPGGAATLQGEKVTLRLLHGQVEQHRVEVALNEFGCATTDYRVPVGSPLGQWDILAQGERLQSSYGFHLNVLEYFKKDIRLEVQGPKEPLIAGSTPDVAAVFTYLAGGVVQGGRVSWSVSGTTLEGSDFDGPDGEGETNLEGRLAIILNTQVLSTRAGGKAATLTVQATGTGPGGQLVHASATLRLAGSGLSVEAEWPDANWLDDGEFEVPLKLLDGAGQAVTADCQVHYYRITDQGSLNPEDWNNPSLKDAGNSAQDQVSNELRLRLPRAGGRYRIVVDGAVGDERFQLMHELLYVAGGRLDNSPFALVPEYDTYDATQPARLLVCQPVAGPVLLNLHADGREFGHRVMQSGTLQVHELEVQESFAPHVHIEARTVRRGDLLATSYAMSVQPASRRITTTVLFDKDRYSPGEAATASIYTFDVNEQPVQAEVALSVWDSALKEFARSALDGTDLYGHFFAGSRKRVVMDVNLTRATRVAPSRRSTAKVKRYRVAPMPAGSYFYGALSWTSARRANLEALIERGVEEGPMIFYGEDAGDSENSDDLVPPSEGETADPYYGDAMESISLGGGGGRGGKGGFAYRRARGGGGRRSDDAADTPTRENFRDSAFFSADIRTSAEGVASVTFTLPDNLTEWTWEAVSTDRVAAVGQAVGRFTAAKPLSARLIGPRGLTQGDEVELTALLQNLGETGAAVSAEFTPNAAPGTARVDVVASPAEATLLVAPGAAASVRWRVKVTGWGDCTVKVRAFTDDAEDTVVWKYRVEPRGMKVTTVKQVRLEGSRQSLDVDTGLPPGAVPERSTLSLHFQGSLLSDLVDALPALVQYPYGCAEQTSNRFVPLLSVMRLLRANNLTLTEIGRQRKTYDGAVLEERWPAELQDADAVRAMVEEGFGRLRQMQNHDGGWGWFNGNRSDVHLSAVVLAGLASARAIAGSGDDIALPASREALDELFLRGAHFLVWAADRDDPALNRRALRSAAMAAAFLKPDPANPEGEVNNLHQDLNERLTAALADNNRGGGAGLGSLVLALASAGRSREAESLARVLVATGKDDGAGGLVFADNGRAEHRWHDTPVEAQALALEAVATVLPKHDAVAKAMKHLRGLRQGSGWGSTRATGQVVSALAACSAAGADDTADATVDVMADGKRLGSYVREKARPLAGTSRLEVPATQLPKNGRVQLARKGGAVTCSVVVHAFVPVAAGVSEQSNGLSIKRSYLRRTATVREVEVEVHDERGKVLRTYTEQRVKYEDEYLSSGDTVNVGDVVVVRLRLKANAGDRYLCLEDARPSCLEPIQGSLKIWKYRPPEVTREDRDTSTVLFFKDLGGEEELDFEYTCVVVAPGSFMALPARAFDMYHESRNGHSDSHVLTAK